MESGLIKPKHYDIIVKVGGLFLQAILLLLTFPRSWSLYPLGAFLACGFIIWLYDFRNAWHNFLKYWYLITPPVIYFILHVLSIAFQGGNILLLEDRLMFLLIPLLGFPLFNYSSFNQQHQRYFIVYIIGIIISCLFLLLRAFIITISNIPEEISFIDYLVAYRYRFFTADLSFLEHPTYLSMKIIWAIFLIISFRNILKYPKAIYYSILIFFSIIILFLASKATIVLWSILIIYLLIGKAIKGSMTGRSAIIIIGLFLVGTGFITIRIARVGEFLKKTKITLNQPVVDWKNLDQRTREWYAAIQLIKEKPISGVGLAKVEERMVEQYHKHGFKEEAELKLNAHNQYLEAQMTFGIAGTLSLLWMLLTPFFFRKRFIYPKLPLALVLIMSFYLLFESMFNRQWGIMFFLLFYCMLIPIFDKRLNGEKVSQNNNLL